jgi:hypothetical protein
LQHALSTQPTARVLVCCAGRLPVADGWTGSLQLPVCMLGIVLPKDFKRFRSFVEWRTTLGHVLVETLLQGVRDSWQPPPEQQATAQQLLAR